MPFKNYSNAPNSYINIDFHCFMFYNISVQRLRGGDMKRKTMVLLALGATMFTTSCNTASGRFENLSQNLIESCKTTVISDNSNLKIEDFSIIGVDVEKNGFDFDVNFNGLSVLSNNTIAYSNINFSAPSSYFDGITKNANTDLVFDAFDRIVADFKPESVSIAQVSNFAEINSAITKNEPQLYNGFKNDKSLLLNLSSPEFNEENQTVSFDSKVLVKLKTSNIDVGVGLGIGFNSGDIGVGVGVTGTVSTGTFIATDTYTLSLTNGQFDQMKENQTLVFDEVVRAISEKDASKISASRKNVRSVTYDCADLLEEFDLNKVNQEISR